jgi:hypothetical protein
MEYSRFIPKIMWSSGSWLQTQRSWFESRCYQIFWELVGLERDALSLVSKIEELLENKNGGSGPENRDYDRRGSAALTKRHPSVLKFDTNFADERRSLGRYSSLADWGHGVFCFVCYYAKHKLWRQVRNVWNFKKVFTYILLCTLKVMLLYVNIPWEINY